MRHFFGLTANALNVEAEPQEVAEVIVSLTLIKINLDESDCLLQASLKYQLVTKSFNYEFVTKRFNFCSLLYHECVPMTIAVTIILDEQHFVNVNLFCWIALQSTQDFPYACSNCCPKTK